MAASKERDLTEDEVAACNEVRLLGRVSGVPQKKVLPSGTVLWTFRVVVPRPPREGSRRVVDVLDCAVWGGRVRRSVTSWGDGDHVEVTGSVRRRFFRGGAGTASRVEIEVSAGRRVRRAASG